MPAPSYAATTEPVPGSPRPVSYQLAQTWDGLYVPYALRLPSQDATGFPFVFLGYGNGGGCHRRHPARTHYPEPVGRLIGEGRAADGLE